MRALDIKLKRTVWRNKGPVAAVAVVVACGVAMFIMALTTLEALQTSRDLFYERTGFADVFASLKRAPDRLIGVVAALPGVQTAESRVVVEATLDIPGLAEPATGRLLSLPDQRAQLNRVVLRDGRLPQPGRADEVVATEAFANANKFGPGDAIRATINGHKRTLRIVGVVLSPEFVYSVAPGMLMPDDRRFGVLWMEREALAAAMDLRHAFNDVMIRLSPDADSAEVLRRIDRLLERNGGFGAYARKDQISHALLAGELDQLRALSQMIPPIFLGIAAFLLNVLMSRLIRMEREQIGLLKALGYGDRAIGRHYMGFALVIVAIGIVLGIAGGMTLASLMAGLYAQFYHFPSLELRPVPWVIAAAAGIAAVAGLVGAWLPARAAARLPPAEAMRPEPPASFHEVAPLIADRLSLPTRMALRNVLRFPIRSGLTVLGIALALADIVASVFAFDSIDRMIEVGFFMSQRFEVMLTFTEPQPARIAFETARLPGVLAAEPFRSVGVTLRHGPRSERTLLTGLIADGELRRVVDPALRTIAIPPHGVLVSPKLAELLDAAPGDVLEVEVLEGKRRRLSLPIAGTAEEYIGTPAYAELSELARAIGEPDTVSGAYLLTDPKESAKLFARLKESPTVATVTVKSATVKSFRDTMAQSMDIMIFFYIGFGLIISLGVLYNSARIALAERSRDLALLRAIGFTRAEVSGVLFVELALLTIAALPLGCALGYGWAWAIVAAFKNNMFIIPLVIERATYGMGVATVLAALLLAGGVVYGRVGRIDLVSGLKAPE